MPQIRITIDALGNPKMEGFGFTGKACDTAMAPIENALKQSGDGKMSYEIKSEWLQSEEQQVHIGQEKTEW